LAGGTHTARRATRLPQESRYCPRLLFISAFVCHFRIQITRLLNSSSLLLWRAAITTKPEIALFFMVVLLEVSYNSARGISKNPSCLKVSVLPEASLYIGFCMSLPQFSNIQITRLFDTSSLFLRRATNILHEVLPILYCLLESQYCSKLLFLYGLVYVSSASR
jgi:hypothetical protein